MQPKLLRDSDRDQIINYCFTRYGVTSDAWSSFDIFQKKEGIWILPIGSYEVATQAMEGSTCESFGQRVLSGTSFPYKVTNSFYHSFSNAITKGRVDLTESEARIILRRGIIEPSSHSWVSELRKSYYLCYYNNKFIGIALKTDSGLVSQVPKSLSAQLGKNLKLGNE